MKKQRPAPVAPNPAAHDQRQLVVKRVAVDAAVRAGFVGQVHEQVVPAKAGAERAIPKELDATTHKMIMERVIAAPAVPWSASTPNLCFTFDQSELREGELYAGLVRNGGIYRHLILMPAEARAVTWQQARTFAAAVDGELPDLEDFDLLADNLRDQFSAEESYWSSECWTQRREAIFLCFGEDPFRDWDSTDGIMHVRPVRRVFAGIERAVVVDWPKHIKTARESERMTLEQLSKLTGIPLGVLSKWEAGEQRTIAGADLANICAVLNIYAGWLLGADDE